MIIEKYDNDKKQELEIKGFKHSKSFFDKDKAIKFADFFENRGFSTHIFVSELFGIANKPLNKFHYQVYTRKN